MVREEVKHLIKESAVETENVAMQKMIAKLFESGRIDKSKYLELIKQLNKVVGEAFTHGQSFGNKSGKH